MALLDLARYLRVLGIPDIITNGAIPIIYSSVQTTTSSPITLTDNGLLRVNNTTSNVTKTIVVGMPTDFGFSMVQQSTGTCTIAAGSGVTFIAPTTTTTTNPGDIITAIWVGANTYIIKVS